MATSHDPVMVCEEQHTIALRLVDRIYDSLQDRLQPRCGVDIAWSDAQEMIETTQRLREVVDFLERCPV